MNEDVNIFSITPIGWVQSPRADPAVDDDWENVAADIVLDEQAFTEESLLGLEQFSHLEVVYLFDRVDPATVERGARHPRGNPAWPKVGIFAQRAKSRPNRLGATACRLLHVDGLRVTVSGLDAIDGTPVADIKPYMTEFAPCGDVRQPRWSHELMADYWQARR